MEVIFCLFKVLVFLFFFKIVVWILLGKDLRDFDLKQQTFIIGIEGKVYLVYRRFGGCILVFSDWC